MSILRRDSFSFEVKFLSHYNSSIHPVKTALALSLTLPQQKARLKEPELLSLDRVGWLLARWKRKAEPFYF